MRSRTFIFCSWEAWRDGADNSARGTHSLPMIAQAWRDGTHSLPMMDVRVQCAFSGNDLVTLRIEQLTTTLRDGELMTTGRDVQRLLNHHLAIPKKEQLLFYEGARLAPFEALRVPVNVTFLRIAPVCAHCGRSAPLRSCSGCLAVHCTVERRASDNTGNNNIASHAGEPR